MSTEAVSAQLDDPDTVPRDGNPAIPLDSPRIDVRIPDIRSQISSSNPFAAPAGWLWAFGPEWLEAQSTVDAIIFSAEPSSASASAPRGRRFRGRATPETRRAAFEAASAWARSQGLIDFTPKYEDRYVFNLHLVTGSRPVDCGADPLCGTQRRMTGGSTSGRNVIVYRAGVEPWLWANDQLVADPDRIAPDRGTWAVNQALNLRSGTESALFVLGHENWHVNNPIRRPARPEDQALEWDANWAGYLFLQAWRNR